MAHTKVTKTGTQNTGTANTFSYSGSFNVFKASEVEVELDNTKLTFTTSTINDSASPREYTVDYSANTIHIGGGDLDSSNTIVIQPVTDMGTPTPRATYEPGSSVTSADLNNNQLQLMRKAMEYDEQKLSSRGGTMTGNLHFDKNINITFEGATANDHETTLTVTDPTADRTITLPNVTGTVVTTGDTGTVTATMLAANSVDSSELVDGSIDSSHIGNLQVITDKIAADAVTGAKIADDAINSEHYTDGSIDTAHIADLQVTTGKIAADAINGAKIADDSVDSEHLVADSIDTEHYAAGSVDTTALSDDAVTAAKLASDSVVSASIVDGSIVNADVNASAAIAGTKVSPDFGSQNIATTGTLTGADIRAVNATFDITNTANNKLGARFQPAAGQFFYHNNTLKLNTSSTGIDVAGNIAVTGTVDGIDIATDVAANTAKVTNATHTGDVTGATTLTIASNAVTESKITDANVTTDKIANNAITIGKIGCEQTTISDSDSHIPTSGAVVDYVAAQIAPIGGLEVIADEDNFPTSQPASGVVISISDAAGIVVNGSGVSTTARTAGNGSDNVTINNFPSSLYSETLASGVGLMVSSTGSSHTYNYHKLLAAETDVKQLSDDINDFNARYRINAGEPSSNNDDGDLVWDTNANKMKVYDATASAWTEVTSTGDFKFLVPVDAGTTTAATFDGSDTSFDLKETTNSGSAASVSNINQLIVSLNGVVQKPNTGSYSASEEGFYLTDTDTIRFCTAPATGSSCFIIQCGSAVSIPTPGDGTVSAVKIASGAVITAKIADDAVTSAKIANLDDNLSFNDSVEARFGTDNDMQISHNGSAGYIVNKTGDLNIYSKQGEAGIVLVPDGTTKLYYDGSKKLETTNTGVLINGQLDLEDSNAIRLGSSDDLQIYHDGTNNWFWSGGGHPTIHESSGSWTVRSVANENYIVATENGAVDLYYDNSKKFETTSAGVSVSGSLSIPDSEVAAFGDGDDLKIYHDGTNNYIRSNGLKNIYINPKDTDVGIKVIGDGGVELYHDNSKRLETDANGIHVTTNVHLPDNGVLELGDGTDASIKHTGSDLFITNSTGGLNIECDSGTGVGEGVVTFSGGSGTEFMRLNNLGDLLINQTTTNDSRLSIKQRSSAVDYINCRDGSNTLNMYCHSSGNLYNTNGNYSQISDQSLKENIVDAKSQWNDIKNIKIRNFNFTKASGMDTHTQIGCVAQEVEKVSPKLVTAPRSDGIKTVANSVLYMKAIKALQEAMAKIETLETKVAALEAA